MRAVLQPTVRRIGVLDLDAVLPPKERTALALRLNALLASPSLRPWRSGPPVDLDAWQGPAAAGGQTFFVLNHLPERERLFFLGRLLGEAAAWTRRQPGSDGLRALLVFDEVFGYFPPHPLNPPTKAPLLTLLKQARAFGVGLVLATQNPVDLDYKGLTNAGLWFLGRLQTEPDRRRVADALGSLPGGASAAARLAEAAPRTFLLHDVRRDSPVLFQTRPCLSYLAGPLSPAQLETLLGPSSPPPEREGERRPPVPAAVPVPAGWTARYAGGGDLHPHLWVEARMAYRASPKGAPVVAPVQVAWLLQGETLEQDLSALPREGGEEGGPAPEPGARPGPLPPYMACLSPEKAARAAAEALAAARPLLLRRDPVTGLLEEPGEGEAAFLRRVAAAREEKERKAREKDLPPLLRERDRWNARLEELSLKAESLRAEARARDAETAVSAGLGLLGGLLGSRRSLGGALSRTLSKKRMADRVDDRLRLLEAERSEAQARLQEVEERIRQAGASVSPSLPPSFETVSVSAPKTGVTVLRTALLWRAKE